MCGVRGGELAFTVFLPFLNCSGALRPFATWVIPPGSKESSTGESEYLARVVFDQDGYYYPDSLVGTDSHTTMIDGLGVLGWGECFLLGSYSICAGLWHGPRFTLIPLHSSSMNLSDQQISEKYFCLFCLLLYFHYPKKCFVPFMQSVWCLEEWIGTRVRDI